MMTKSLLTQLSKLDKLKLLPYHGCETYLHKDHRWVIPILADAQQRSILPRPCTLVMFDYHTDCLVPACLDIIKSVRAAGNPIEQLMELCQRHLFGNDDNWVVTAFELGLVGDAVIFGAKAGAEEFRLEPRRWVYTDHLNTKHEVFLLSMPFDEMDFQGHLCDHCKTPARERMRQLLGWQCSQETWRFEFTDTDTPIWLDFDLDCFAGSWLGHSFPWPKKIWDEQFLEHPEEDATTHYTGGKFVVSLAAKASLLTVAQEPGCCGGASEARAILRQLDKYVFENQLLSR